MKDLLNLCQGFCCILSEIHIKFGANSMLLLYIIEKLLDEENIISDKQVTAIYGRLVYLAH